MCSLDNPPPYPFPQPHARTHAMVQTKIKHDGGGMDLTQIIGIFVQNTKKLNTEEILSQISIS